MMEQQTSAPEGGEGVASPVPQPQPAATGVEATGERVVTEAEAEIRKLVQELHDKIVALAGEHWITTVSDELREARASVESAAEWVAEHFKQLARKL